MSSLPPRPNTAIRPAGPNEPSCTSFTMTLIRPELPALTRWIESAPSVPPTASRFVPGLSGSSMRATVLTVTVWVTGALTPPSLSSAVTVTVFVPVVRNVCVTTVPDGPVTVSTADPSPQSIRNLNPAAVSTVDGSLAFRVKDAGSPGTETVGPVSDAVGTTLVTVNGSLSVSVWVTGGSVGSGAGTESVTTSVTM